MKIPAAYGHKPVQIGRKSPASFSGGIEYYDSVNKVKIIAGENGQIITIIPGRG